MGRIFDFIANCSDGVFAVDRGQSVVLWNEAASAILGYSARGALGAHCYNLLRGADSAGCAVCRRGCDAITAAERLEHPPTKEMSAHNKTGLGIWLSVSSVVVPSRIHELSVLIHLFREVTREHELTRVMGEFAAVVVGLKRGSAMPPRREDATRAGDSGLTRREGEILALLAQGVSTEEQADRLCISRRTVRNHVANILLKLGVHSRLEAVTYSIRNGLV